MDKRIYISILLVVLLAYVGKAQVENILIQSGSNGTGSLIVGPVNVGVDLTVNRYLPSSNWHIIASPVAKQQLGDFIANSSIVFNTNASDYDLAPYNESTNAWDPYTEAGSTSEFGIGEGYSVRRAGPGNVVFKGTAVSGTVTVSVTNSGNGGWNAVGNPYTSVIRAKGLLSFLNLNTAVLDPNFGGIYIWDQSLGGTGDYTVITQSGYTFPPPGGEQELDQNFLAVGQGFLVRAASDGEVTFNRLMQTHAVSQTSAFKSGEISWPAIRLKINTGTMENKAVVTFHPEMSDGLDPGYDAGKYKGNPKLALYSQLVEDNGVDFMVQALPNNRFEEYRIPIGLDFPKGGYATFTSEQVNLPAHARVIIEDTKTNSFTHLDGENKKYVTFIDQEQKGYGRFYLHTSNALITSVDQKEESAFQVFSAKGVINVLGETKEDTEFRLYSSDGKLYYQNRPPNQNRNTISTQDLSSGIYMLHIYSAAERSVHKVFVTGR